MDSRFRPTISSMSELFTIRNTPIACNALTEHMSHSEESKSNYICCWNGDFRFNKAVLLLNENCINIGYLCVFSRWKLNCSLLRSGKTSHDYSKDFCEHHSSLPFYKHVIFPTTMASRITVELYTLLISPSNSWE